MPIQALIALDHRGMPARGVPWGGHPFDIPVVPSTRRALHPPHSRTAPHQDGWELVASIQQPGLDFLPGGKTGGCQAGGQVLDETGVQRDADKLLPKLCVQAFVHESEVGE